MNNMIGVYPGPASDNSFLYLPEFKNVKKWILVDGLPNNNHCPKGCHGYQFYKDLPTLIDTLNDAYGSEPAQHNIRKSRLKYHIGKKTILYYYNTNIEDFKFNCKIDVVYFRGFSTNTIDHNLYHVACDTVIADCEDNKKILEACKIVHTRADSCDKFCSCSCEHYYNHSSDDEN